MDGEVPTGAGTVTARSSDAPIVVVGGGIGAGKSSVAQLLGDAGFVLVIADDLGRSVLDIGEPAVREVEQRWPEVVTEGVVDRSALARIVFGDPAELRALERITHPRIAGLIAEAIAAAHNSPVVVEVPVLPLASSLTGLRVAVVADDDIRLARAVQRGGDEADVRMRMRRQPSDDEWSAWADHVIDNSGAWADTERQVLALVEAVQRD